MSGHGAPSLSTDASGAKVAIVASSWHTAVMDGLVAGAQLALADAHASDVTLIRTAGSFELPLVAKAAAEAEYDVVIALGVIIRGGTPHFEYVSSAATDGLSRASLDTGVPIGFGLLTCDTEEQALDRAGLADSREDKGREAAEAALASWATLGWLRG
ncbi:6,7-dimethyl-8-ribityllumazine synthase [Aeromicrobium sp. YIM 150415]|uniref:6,7-dimethyl-8-ribityllumazine synthase n=1 Tax=Aeromicrobium piscarium TaxID=2590901 RepID=A0A554S6V0_9ACTN|nr:MULTISPECIES: 6,7-dimethyl-8-ribityllumazine synthase [Aeromicrobium]MBM9464903.1 6,7-dimethyl-8-ribityllumazine synthase [Aeromicrobium sp. YIM 150415]TSD62062.1 6,7-dimethyl-8-ribityllumazine synthase [Aeromicrobium piscarium]